jgi:hypothetical protein
MPHYRSYGETEEHIQKAIVQLGNSKIPMLALRCPSSVCQTPAHLRQL